MGSASALRAMARQGGFTLIEIMVALVVFSLAALALIRLEGATIRSTGMLDASLGAQLVARNVAIDAMTGAQPPTLGQSSGSETNGGRAWRWTRDVRPTGNTQVVRIDVAVRDASGATLARLTMVRPPNPPATVAS